MHFNSEVNSMERLLKGEKNNPKGTTLHTATCRLLKNISLHILPSMSLYLPVTQVSKKAIGPQICFLPSMLSSKQTWQKDKVPVSVSSLQTLQILSSFRSMFTNCSSSSMVPLVKNNQ